MVMRDRPVIVPLRKPLMRMEPLGRRIVVMSVGEVLGLMRERWGVVIMRVRGHCLVVLRVRRHVVIVRVRDIGRERDLVNETGFIMRMIGHVLNFNLQVMAVIEDRARERGRSMVDLEDVLHPVEHDDRHLDGQRHAQPHAEPGDVPFGDCESLADHDSSRSGSGPGSIGQPASRRQVGGWIPQ